MRAVLAGLVTVAFGALPVAATTYVMPSDELLVRQAAVVAQVTVAAVEPAPISGPPSTDYFVQIERVLKGYVAGGTVVVRVPGGIGPDGRGLRIWGAPTFAEGERLLLFLEPRRDGTYGILHLALGAFTERQQGGLRVALRALAEAAEISLSPAGDEFAGQEPLREFGGFAEWIGTLAEGERRDADYLVAGFAAGSRRARPDLLRDSCTNLGFRWFEFDRGESVAWRLHRAGFDGRGGERRAFERARRAWVRKSGLDLRLERSAPTVSAAGLTQHDGQNTVLFNDPDDLVSGAYQCGAGGLVSVTGIWFENGRGQACERISAGRKGEYRDHQYLEILEADTVANDGTACLFSRDGGLTGQVLAHELGHSLGLAHAGADASLMRGELDGAATRIAPRPADRHALGELYRVRPDGEEPAAGSTAPRY